MAPRVTSNRTVSASDDEVSGTAALIDEFDRYLEIDENALEEALSVQSTLYFRVCDALALEGSKRDVARHHRRDTENAIELALRNDFEAADKKVTEGKLKTLVQSNPEAIKARNQYYVLEGYVNRLSALKEAYHQRSYALKELVNLYVTNYFSGQEDEAKLAKRRMSEARDRATR